MPKKIFKRFSPDKQKLMKGGIFKSFNTFFHKAPVWHLNRRSARRAVLIGAFFALLPLPMQTCLAIIACILIRANLPIVIAIVWLTNPLTIPPVFYATYRFGAFLLDIPMIEFEFEMSWQWLIEQMRIVWRPLFLGSLTVGISLAALSYTAVDILWRRHTLKRWRNRQAIKKLGK